MQEKFTFAGIGGLLFSLLGRVDWLIVFYLVCMMIDYFSGTLSAIKQRKWTANKAAIGIWKKVGSIFAVIVGIILDLIIFLLNKNFYDSNSSFYNKPIFCGLVLVWYIITELGSIIENAEKMGAPMPKFLKKYIDSIKDSINKGDEIINKQNNKKGK